MDQSEADIIKYVHFYYALKEAQKKIKLEKWRRTFFPLYPYTVGSDRASVFSHWMQTKG